jgi:hypothetical protein
MEGTDATAPEAKLAQLRIAAVHAVRLVALRLAAVLVYAVSLADALELLCNRRSSA